MKNNDQWFEPGDKVMRVAQTEKSYNLRSTPFGKVFCVERCWAHEITGRTVMTLVGMFDYAGADCMWTYNFRKVEEIKLCVKAAKKIRQPAQPEPVTP